MEYGKYIIIEHGATELAILFDSLFDHSSMFQNKDMIISAGFFAVGQNRDNKKDIDDISVSTWGKSVTLNLESRKEDKRPIKKVLRDWNY